MKRPAVKYALLPHYKTEYGEPCIAYASDAGLDLRYMGDRFKLIKETPVIMPTGLIFEIPEGWCGLIMERSGLGLRGSNIHGRVIDAGYRGEVQVIMSCVYSNGGNIIRIDPGDKIAQIVFVPHLVTLQKIDISELSSTQRGEKGFGSSG